MLLVRERTENSNKKTKARSLRTGLSLLVAGAGFEPATFGL
jgi:hypothetical protein